MKNEILYPVIASVAGFALGYLITKRGYLALRVATAQRVPANDYKPDLKVSFA